jgi:hypothetical protein
VHGKEGNFLRKFNDFFPVKLTLLLLRAPYGYDFRLKAKIPSFGDETTFLFREKGFSL